MLYCSSKETGVYLIVCNSNGFTYIGSASSKTGFRGRIMHHRSSLKRGQHHSKLLQKDFDKYGEETFEVIVLEVCPPMECLECEQWWIDTNGVGAKHNSYNTCPFPGLAPSRLGTKQTPETIAKRVASNKGNPWPQEIKRRSAKLIGLANCKEYVVWLPEFQEIKIRNLAEFCRQHGLKSACMIKVAQGTATHHHGWLCRYATDTLEDHAAKVQSFLDKRLRQYVLIAPDGTEYKTDKLLAFCQTHGLSQSSMSAVANADCLSYKGWKCRYLNEPEHIYQKRLALKPKGKEYVVTQISSGEQIRVFNLTEFCQRHGLLATAMIHLANGRNNQHRGYRCRHANTTDT